jgi:hypothetical protein
LEICLEVLDEFFIEDLIETLNEIVGVFYEEVVPYSIRVSEKLTDAYQDIMRQLDETDAEMENSKITTTANGCLNAIFRLVISIGGQNKENNQQVLSKIEETVHDVLINSLTPGFQDVHESVMNCIGAFTFHCPSITMNLWRYFPKLITLLEHNLEKQLNEYGLVGPGITAIMNFMQKDSDTFINVDMENGQTPYVAVVNIISTTMKMANECKDVLIHKTGIDLVIGLLENLHGKIDESISSIIELLGNEMSITGDRSSKLLIVQALCMCFAYNVEITFKIIEEKGWTKTLFAQIFEALGEAKYDFEIQRIVIGFCSIVKCTNYHLPQIVVDAMPQIFRELLSLCQKSVYRKQQKNKTSEKERNDQREEDYNILDDWSDEEEYDDDDEYDPEDSKGDGEELYKSYTQDVDEVSQLKNALQGLHTDVFNSYFSRVSSNEQADLQK